MYYSVGFVDKFDGVINRIGESFYNTQTMPGVVFLIVVPTANFERELMNGNVLNENLV